MTIVENQIRENFIRAHTVLLSPALVPEVKLHLATGVMQLWGDTERLAEIGTTGSGALPPPYWAFAWPGGQAMARYILDRPSLVAGRTVLDFGSGSGLVAIAAAKAGAAHVTAAEIDPLALAVIALNAAVNDVEIERTSDEVIDCARQWDVIVAGDMCYERPMTERLLPWLHRIAAAGPLVMIGDPGRAYFPDSGVTLLSSYDVPTSRDLEAGEMRRTSVYALADLAAAPGHVKVSPSDGGKK